MSTSVRPLALITGASSGIGFELASQFAQAASTSSSTPLALQDELRDSPATVTSLMPGPTETRFFSRAGMLDTNVGRSSSKDDAGEVARQGYEALMRGERRVVAGSLMTKAMAASNKVMPDPV